ncbi:MAG: 30S ribosomal protein S7 [Bacteroidota bacterium]
MRKGQATPRTVAPDPKYRDLKAGKFINRLMKEGKKDLARNIFYKALDLIEKKTGKSGLETFHLAYENVKPVIESVRRRASGTIRQVPMEVRPTRKKVLTNRWLVEGARKAHGKSMAEKLANELIAASQGEGSNAIKQKNTVQKMAESNKAFASVKNR